MSNNWGSPAPQAGLLIIFNIENDMFGEISAAKSGEISAPKSGEISAPKSGEVSALKNPQGVGPWGARVSGSPGGQAHSSTGNIENDICCFSQMSGTHRRNQQNKIPYHVLAPGRGSLGGPGVQAPGGQAYSLTGNIEKII